MFGFPTCSAGPGGSGRKRGRAITDTNNRGASANRIRQWRKSSARQERRKGSSLRTLTDQEITLRALLAMANEAALALQEKIVVRASDIDVVFANGFGFPKWEGGPVFWAQDRGIPKLVEDLDWLAQLSGPGFIRGDMCDNLFRTRSRGGSSARE